MGTTSEAALYLALERGYFAQKNIATDFITLDSAAKSIPYLANGDIDVAAGVLSAGLFNAVNQGLDIRIVASQSENRGCEHSATWVLVRKDLADSGAIRATEDLRGRRIALASKASTVEYLADALLRQGNLQPSDVEYVELPFGDMGAAFANHAIDVAIGSEPTATSYADNNLATKWLCASDIMPNLQYTYIFFGPRFWRDHPQVAQAWMAAYLRGVNDWQAALNSAELRQPALETLTRFTPVKDVGLLARMNLSALTPGGAMHLDNIRNQVAWARERGYIDKEPSVDVLVDSSFVDQAARATGK
ncbi:MAG: ABC transporter substrate-binding protein [Chloroflexi bacterium]|nr:ABC transporter substrate-binding protein [Chloroflexota bacterium]